MTTNLGFCDECATPITSAWTGDPAEGHLTCPQCGHQQTPFPTYPLILPLKPIMVPRWKLAAIGLIVAALAAVIGSGYLGWCLLFGERDDEEVLAQPTTSHFAGPAETVPSHELGPMEQHDLPPDSGPEEDPSPNPPDLEEEQDPSPEEPDKEADAGPPDSGPDEMDAPEDASDPAAPGGEYDESPPPEADEPAEGDEGGADRASTDEDGAAGGGAPTDSGQGDSSQPGGSGVRLRFPPTFFVNVSPVCSLAISPDRQTLAYGHEDRTVRLWHLANDAEEHPTFACSAGAPKAMAFHPGGQVLAALQEDRVDLFEIASGRRLGTIESRVPVSCLAFSGDGRHLAIGEANGDAVIRVTRSLAAVHRLPGYGGVMAIAWCGTREQFAVASADNVVRCWSPLGGEAPARLVGHMDWVSSIDMVDAAGLLLTGSWDSTLRLWTVDSMQPMGVLRGHRSRITCAAASPLGQRTASATDRGLIKVWDNLNGMELATFRGHMRGVTGLVFVNEHWLVSASADGSAKAWDLATGISQSVPDRIAAEPTVDSATDPRITEAARYAEIVEQADRFVEQEQFDQAAERYRSAVELRPRYAEPHLCLGECLLQLEQVGDAIDAFKRAVELQPNSGWKRYRLGAALLTAGDKSRAVKTLTEAIELFPDAAQIRVCLANALSSQDRYMEAIHEFQEAAKMLTNSYEVEHGLGVAYRGLRKWKEAEQHLRRAIDLHRDFAPAYSALVDVILSADPKRAKEAQSWVQLAATQNLEIRPETKKRLEQLLTGRP
jgi:WD40 repeat protein/cytochrome c-type biogenesis protein CcmH/NrfG